MERVISLMHSMKVSTIRSAFFRVIGLLLVAWLVGGLCVAHGFWVETTWLKLRKVTLADEPEVRLAHITDIHYKGNRAYLEKVVRVVNETGAEIVCFTGDLVEELKYLDECLEILSQIEKPLYGVAGNHDHWARVPFDKIRTCFRKTGGDWLSDTNAFVLDGRLELVGSSSIGLRFPVEPAAKSRKRVLLSHYPTVVDKLPEKAFDLILAGHSHGGQVRIPFIGGKVLPYDVGPYEVGLYQTDAGPLYVNPGIGTYYLNVRFFCRPEVTVIEL